MESTILRFFSWAEKAAEPLQSYATGLLAAAMEVQDIATNFRFVQPSIKLKFYYFGLCLRANSSNDRLD